jgi:hypothetical protein
MKGILKGLVVLAFVVAALPAFARDPNVLLVALQRGDAGTVAMELSLGAELPMALSVVSGVRPEIMRLMPLTLIGSASAKIAQPPVSLTRLVAAMRSGDPRAVQIEIANGADPEAAMVLEGYMTPAMVAALSPFRVSAANALAAETSQDTPLMAAARCGNCKALVALLAAGANPLERNAISGLRASDIAAAAGMKEAEAILVAYSSNLGLIFMR